MVDLNLSKNAETAKTIVTSLQNSGVDLSISEEDNSEIVVTSSRDLTISETNDISAYKKEILDEISSKITTSDTGTYPKRVFRTASISSDSGIVKLQSQIGSQGVATINGSTGEVEVVNSVCGETGDVHVVCTFNSATGAVEGVNSFNGATGIIEGVNSINGSTGAVTLTDLVGVSTFNGLSGAIDTSSLVLTVAGLSAGSSVQTMNGLVINQGKSGDSLSIAIGGTALIGAPLDADTNSLGANIAIGNGALGTNTTGLYNTAIGYGAIYSDSDGTGSVAIGHACSYNANGSYNTSIGHQAFKNGDGTKNVAIGQEALYNAGVIKNGLSNSDYNVAIGASAGHGLSHGINNIFIGYDTRPTASEISNQIAIGNTSSAYLYTAAGISAGGATFGSNIIVHGGISANSGISTAGNLNVGGGTLQGVNNFDGGTLSFVGAGNIIHNSGGISSSVVQATAVIGTWMVNKAGFSSDGYLRHSGGISAGGNLETQADLHVAENIEHVGDTNTKVGFTTDRVEFVAGGVTFAYGVSGAFYANKGITVTGNVLISGGISANAGISTSGRVDANKLWVTNGISSDHAITTSHNIIGSFGRCTSSGISSNAGISTASGIQFSDGSIATSYTDTIGVYVTNGSRTITTGIKGRKIIPYDCTVTEWVVTGSTSGSITWDVNWGKTSAWPNALASVGFSGNGSSPQLGATASQSYVLIPTAWTKSGFSAGDVIQFEVDSVSTITDCELALKIKRMDGT